MIDARTIIISYAITNIVCTSVMSLLWVQNRNRFAGIGFWVGNYVAICVAVVLLALRGVVPDLLSIVVANTLIIFGIILLYIGLERFVGKPSSQLHNYILLVIFLLVHVYYTYIHPSLLARNLNFSVGMLVGTIQIAWFIFRRLDPQASFNFRNLGVIILGYSMISIARIIADLSVDPGNDFLKANTDSLSFLFYQILQIALAFSLFLKVNHQLVGDLVLDVSERKKAEDELVRAKEAIESVNIELQTALEREQLLARTDPLTGVNNRRHLFELAEHAFHVAMRYQQTLSVIMFDIDHFKQVNDTFGHVVGDQILQNVAQTARVELRSADVIGRYGGEEFLIVLPVTTAQQAYSLAERIREGVAAIRLPAQKEDAHVTLSIGIAELLLDGNLMESTENIIRCADDALYAAKQAGRNRTEIFESKLLGSI